jgi:hypothetical protein
MRKTKLFLLALPFLVLAAGTIAIFLADFLKERKADRLLAQLLFALPPIAVAVWARLFAQNHTIYVVGVVLHLCLVGLGPVGGALAVYTALDRGETDPGRLAGAAFFAVLGLSCVASGFALWRLAYDDQAEWAWSMRCEARVGSWFRALKELFFGAQVDFSRRSTPRPVPRDPAPPAKEEPPGPPPEAPRP